MEVTEFSGDYNLKIHVFDGNLFSISFYDNNPVYFSTNSCDTIKWVAKKDVFCASIEIKLRRFGFTNSMQYMTIIGI